MITLNSLKSIRDDDQLSTMMYRLLAAIFNWNTVRAGRSRREGGGAEKELRV